jgi:hypothetical protein
MEGRGIWGFWRRIQFQDSVFGVGMEGKRNLGLSMCTEFSDSSVQFQAPEDGKSQRFQNHLLIVIGSQVKP